MQKFRKKPVEVEAIQFTHETKNRVFNELAGRRSPDFENGDPILKIETIHGETAVVRVGDWIVKEPKIGCYYPVKPDIFAATYEPVTD